MIDAADIALLMKSVGSVMKEYVGAAIGVLTNRVDGIEKAVKEIPAGPMGEKGERGEPGQSIKGDRGEDGAPGVSIKGDPGKDGTDGKPGIDGKDGTPGESVKGIDGKDGRDGRDGKDGRDGDPGRDALQIEILPMVEEGKSYPRGTFAKHKGGLIRAVRNTGPFVLAELEKSGWEVIVEGIQNFTVVQNESLRSFTFECVRTSGYAHVHTFHIPALLYRGIFKDGTEYERGDTVTYSGSTWHCNAEQTKAKPGTSEDWQMIVRKGNDGKDGQRGNDGGQGPEGRPGRDLTQMGPDGRKH